MPKPPPRLPRDIFATLEVRRLVAAGLFQGGVRRTLLPIVDPRDVAADNREPVEVATLPGGRAAVSIGGQAIPAASRPGLGGRDWWTLACPTCRAASRKLYRPVGLDHWRCRECWRVAKPSRSPRWRGIAPEVLARSVADQLAASSRPSPTPPTEAAAS